MWFLVIEVSSFVDVWPIHYESSRRLLTELAATPALNVLSALSTPSNWEVLLCWEGSSLDHDVHIYIPNRLRDSQWPTSGPTRGH